MTEERRNSWAKFASPEDDVGIGYYDDGTELTPEDFRRVAEDAAKARAEGEKA